MSLQRNFQAMRDQLEKNDEVLVRRTTAPDGPTYHGKILEVMGRVARVRMTKTERVEVVPLVKLSKVTPLSERLTHDNMPLAKAIDSRALMVQQDTAATIAPPAAVKQAVRALVEHQKPLVLPPVGEVTPAPDDLTAWLDMGMAMGQQMKLQIEEHLQAADCLNEEANICLKQSADHSQQAKELQKKLDALIKITGK